MTIRSINGTSESLNLCPVLPASVTCSICLVLTPLANRLKPYDNEVVTGEMRVQITYDVETGDAIEMKELPFVLGVLSDLSGKPEEPLPRLRDRKFVEIDRDNFDAVMRGMKPGLAFRVDNKLSDDNTQMAVELKFNALEDFEPEQVVRQVEPLRKLLETRLQLQALLAKMDGNDKLTEKLQEIISNTDMLKKIGSEVGAADGGKEDRGNG